MIDDTEPVRRTMLAEQRANGPFTREELAAKYGEVWDTLEMSERFVVTGFMAPLAVVKRRSDGQKGSLEFQHMPRFYYSFQPYTGLADAPALRW